MDIIIEKNSSGSYQSTIVGDTSAPFISADCSTVIWNACSNLAYSSDAENTIVFPFDTYHLWPNTNHPMRIPFLLTCCNVKIEGNGSTFICHGHMGFAALDYTGEVLMQDMTIDWEHPYIIQATVKCCTSNRLVLLVNSEEYNVSIQNNHLVLMAEPQSGAADINDFISYKAVAEGCELYDGYGNILQGFHGSEIGNAIANGTASQISTGSDGIKEIEFTGLSIQNPVSLGTRILINVNTVSTVGNALNRIDAFTLNHSWKTTLRNININHSLNRGILGICTGRKWLRNWTTNTWYYDTAHPDEGFVLTDGCQTIVKPGTDRCFSSLAGFAHFCNCKGHITVQNSTFTGMGGDVLNIHGRYYKIAGAATRRIIIIMAEDVPPVAGDLMYVISQTNLERTISNPMTEEIMTVSVNSVSLIGNANGIPLYMIELNSDLPTQFNSGDYFENATWTTDVTVKNCVFEKKNRDRGLLITTPKEVRIFDNVFHTAGTAILIAADYNTAHESGGVRDVEIYNNVFAQCATSIGNSANAGAWGHAVITIKPANAGQQSTLEKVHSGINIHDNTFYMHDVPILFARAVNGLTFQDNAVWKSLPPLYVANVANQQVAFRLEGVTGWSETRTRWASNYQNDWMTTESTDTIPNY